MRVRYLSIIPLLLLPSLAWADDCTVIEQGYAFFDGKKSAWQEKERISILDCGGSYFLTFTEDVGNRELGRVAVTKPAKGETWYVDGLTCSEYGSEPVSAHQFYRNKAILVADSHLREAWAVEAKTKKWQKLATSTLQCEDIEP